MPIVPPPRLVLQPAREVLQSPPVGLRNQQVSLQGRDASPMSVASTGPAVFDPTLHALRPLLDLSDRDAMSD